MKPVVSVVLPVYNMADFIGEAIDSVLAQSFTDFELIIIDDASTDRTFKIVQSYKDHRISVISNESNIGHIKSRNKAMRIARGKYIAVMDSDDVSCINRLKIQTEFLEANEEINEFVTIENANFFDEINTIINARYATLDNDSFYFGKKGIDYYRNKFALLNIHK